MATNDFKPFAIGAGANVMSQSDYLALAALITGFQSGKASSAQVNKALRQSSTMASVLAQFIADTNGTDVLDNGDVSDLLLKLKSAVATATTGRLINIQRFTSSITYTPSPGTKFVIIEAVGGGGGGGAAQGRTTAANQTAAAAAGGGGGAYAKVRLNMDGVSSLSVTIGAGGSGGAASSTVGNAGDPGGETSVSNGATKLITCPGGSGGNGAIQLSFNSLQQQTNRGSEIASSNAPAEALIVMPGSQGESGWTSGSGSARSGAGGSTPFGMGGSAITSQSQGTDFLPGVGRGGGGGGGISPYISGAQTPSGIGGLGSGGCVIFWEYA